jgi:hypothetical protein
MKALKRYHIADDMQTMRSPAPEDELGASAADAPAYRAQTMAQTGTEETR